MQNAANNHRPFSLRSLPALLAACAVLSSVCSGCRRGEDDPDVSFQDLVEEFRPSQYVPMAFGTHLDFAGYAAGFAISEEAMFGELAVVEETGLEVVRLDLSFDAWLYLDGSSTSLFYSAAWDDTIRKKMGTLSLKEYAQQRMDTFDALVARIRSAGLGVMIADAAAEQYWGAPQQHADFVKAFVSRVQALAGRYKPEYYVVVKEPSWYMGKWGTSMLAPEMATTDDWVKLTRVLCMSVKKVSPTTRCAVAISLDGYENDTFSKTDYIVAVSKIAEVDILGFDIYGRNEFTEMDAILSTLKPALDGTAKELWILETWTSGSGNMGKEWMAKADGEWITAAVYYAQSRAMGGFVPFYSQHFISYEALDHDEFSKYKSQRTPAFHAYKGVIAEVHDNAGK